MGTPHTTRPDWLRSRPLLLGLILGAAAALYPLLPEAVRPWNFAAFGAIGLFVAARVGFVPAVLLAAGSKLAFDLIQYKQKDFHPDYVMDPTVYVCLVGYAALGWLFLRRTRSPLAIGGVAVGGGVVFFLVTNFVAWLDPVHAYPRTIGGLLQCYALALPFHRGTVIGDVGFTALLFGLDAVFARVATPAVEPVPVAEEVRS